MKAMAFASVSACSGLFSGDHIAAQKAPLMGGRESVPRSWVVTTTASEPAFSFARTRAISLLVSPPSLLTEHFSTRTFFGILVW